MSETTAMGVARNPAEAGSQENQAVTPEEQPDIGPFSTPARARRTKMMMLIGASVCIFILMVLVSVGGN